MNDLSPTFNKEIEMDYYFEKIQQLRFEVYDIDEHTGKPEEKNADFLGQYSTSLAQLVRVEKTTGDLMRPDGRPMKSGRIEITTKEVQSFREKFELTFSASNLPKHGLIFKSKPSTRLLLQSHFDGQKWRTVFCTKAVHNSVNPNYTPFSLRMYKLTLKEGNVEERIRICICDANNNSHEYGAVVITIADFIEESRAQSGKSWKIDNSSSGASFIVLNKAVVSEVYTFFEYIQRGLELNFAVAIDFTASNGNPQSRDSLHFLSGQYLENDYTRAIEAVGRVIEEYDTDKFIPVLGFGAKLPPDFSFVSHNFALSMNTASCFGVDQVLQAYRDSLPHLRLYGPTNFSPVIRHVANMARSFPLENKKYFVLLILTDGVITDMEETVNAIIEASDLAMSIIIVGVGNADFDKMNLIDSDDRVLTWGDRKASRDIVQFVPFNDYRQCAHAVLAKQVLYELPHQVTDFYAHHGIKP